MIPTREQIRAIEFGTSPLTFYWLRAMRDEIDRLQPKVCCGDFADCGNSSCVPKLRHEINRLTAELARSEERCRVMAVDYADLGDRARKAEAELAALQPAPTEKPAASVPDHFPDAGKMVPDNTRELVAQLADVVRKLGFYNEHAAEVEAIAAKLRGGA